MNTIFDYLIIGAGLFGASFAQKIREHGKTCLVIDKRIHIGGNTYCRNEEGINIHEYGAHIFHTDKEDIWQYVNRFIQFNHFINSPLANYKGQLYNLPFNMNTFNKLWGVNTPEEAKGILEKQRKAYQHITEPKNLEEQALKLCGEDIYRTFIKEYTEKQWGCSTTELPAFIIRRLPFRFTYDNNYFDDPYQGIPIGGYNLLIANLLKGVEVKLSTNYFDNREFFDSLAKKIVFTGCIDEFFNYEFGHLDYRSLKFEHEYLKINNFQGNAVINYNEASVPFTRIIEHKHFEFGQQPHTIITKEYPQSYQIGGEPYYPINNEKNMKTIKQYKEKSIYYSNVLFGGRLAQYAYLDMDDTIEAALYLAKKELNS
ncbi:UDP-galactopyranose mutase [uncultured Parabacteroides sp.]|uniref:UDP-galactopyranose mutase n=1 Tax=uncultured Parabacteroides sp. TaxID=512312 RepID=UPI0025883302|nr:UDP-galactopyranose mutase [uncultured Parabacteroides sp.]